MLQYFCSVSKVHIGKGTWWLPTPFQGTVEEMHPLALMTKADTADNPNWGQAMNGPDSAGYWEAYKKELHMLVDRKHAWDVIECQPWMNVLPSTWAFQCKRYPDGSVPKLKARFCTHGDKQVEGIDYFYTLAPSSIGLW